MCLKNVNCGLLVRYTSCLPRATSWRRVDDGISLLFWIENPPVGGPQCGLLWEFLFSIIGKMSFTQNRRGDFQGIKTREFILQDSSGNFPAKASLLVIGDEKGSVTTASTILSIPDATITVGEIATKQDSTGRYAVLDNTGIRLLNSSGNINNPGEFSINKDPVNGNFSVTTLTTGQKNITIDATGQMVVSKLSTNYNPSAPTDSNINVNGNVNVRVNSTSSQQTGNMTAGTVVLQDRVTTGTGRIWSSNNDLFWQSPNGLNNTILTNWQTLLEPSTTTIQMANDLNSAIAALNQIIDIFNKRNIFFSVTRIPLPVIFKTSGAVVFRLPNTTPTFIPSTLLPYNDINDLLTDLSSNTSVNSIVFDTDLKKVYIDTTKGSLTITDGTQKGSAQRLLNHLGFSNKDGTPILTVPPSGSLTIQQTTYGRTLDASGLGYKLVLPNPNNITISASGSRYVSIQWENRIPDYTPNAPYDILKHFGLYKDGKSFDILAKSGATSAIQNYTFYGLVPNKDYTFAVSSIGMYDERGPDASSSFTFYTNTDMSVPPGNGNGIVLTQYEPNTSIPNVDPSNPATYGSMVGRVDSSGVDSFGVVIPYNPLTTKSYLYSSAFTITFPDQYNEVYIGFYSPEAKASVDAYRLTISSKGSFGVWEEQQVSSMPGAAQYFGPYSFAGGASYSATLVAMSSQYNAYSLGIFFVQAQSGASVGIDPYRRYSTTLDQQNQYPRTPLLRFCSK